MAQVEEIGSIKLLQLKYWGFERMSINYKGTETEDLLMALEDAFNSNRAFKGYALEADQMGNGLRLNIVTDE